KATAGTRGSSNDQRFPPVAWLAYFVGYLLIVEVVLVPFSLVLSFDSIAILVLPPIEESLKLYIARSRRQYTFYGIIFFGLIELVLVKGLFLIEAPLSEMPLLAGFALFAFIFHLATAAAYANSDDRNYLYAVYGACLGLHISFNAAGLMVPTVSGLVTVSVILALAPIAAGSLILRYTREKPG